MKFRQKKSAPCDGQIFFALCDSGDSDLLLQFLANIFGLNNPTNSFLGELIAEWSLQISILLFLIEFLEDFFFLFKGTAPRPIRFAVTLQPNQGLKGLTVTSNSCLLRINAARNFFLFRFWRLCS